MTQRILAEKSLQLLFTSLEFGNGDYPQRMSYLNTSEATLENIGEYVIWINYKLQCGGQWSVVRVHTLDSLQWRHNDHGGISNH